MGDALPGRRLELRPDDPGNAGRVAEHLETRFLESPALGRGEKSAPHDLRPVDLLVVLGFVPNIIFKVTDGAVSQTIAIVNGLGG